MQILAIYPPYTLDDVSRWFLEFQYLDWLPLAGAVLIVIGLLLLLYVALKAEGKAKNGA